MANELLRQANERINRLPRTSPPPSLREVLDFQAGRLLDVQRDAMPVVAAIRAAREATALDLDGAREAIAREHRFAGWAEAMAHGDRTIDPRFEAAADAICLGDVATLGRLLAEDPALARARSGYGHACTLLQHVAANGIESCRQWQSPPNAVEVARALIDAGAEVDATCRCYGVVDTTLTLLVSSAHPADVGVQADLVTVLCASGARPDGIDDDGAPLWTAILSGYQKAVSALARAGARIDNLVFAACAGDVARVQDFLEGRATPGPSGERTGAHGRALDPTRTLEYATIYASGMGRREVVALLLEHGPDLTFREPVHGATALGMARYPHPAAGRPQGNPDVAALLEATR